MKHEIIKNHIDKPLNKELILKIERLENDVIGFLKYMTRDNTLSLDLAQESILRSWPFISKSSDPTELKSYVLKVARNLAIDHFRNHGRRIESLNTVEEEIKLFDKNNETPEDKIIEKEEKEILQNELSSLRSKHKEILTLYYYNDLNLKQIAALMEIPLNTAITKLCRARAELKKKISKGI